MLRLIPIIAFLLLSGTVLQAQKTDTLRVRPTSNIDRIGSGLGRGPNADAVIRQAIKSRHGKDYFAAMKYYALAIEADSTDVRAYEGYAEAASAIYLLGEAEATYHRLAYRDTLGVDSTMLLRLAAIKMMKGEYEDAAAYYGQLTGKSFRNPDDSLEVLRGLENINWILEKKFRSLPVFSLEPLSGGINDRYYSEYAAATAGDTLYYASFSFPFEKDHHYPKRELIKLLSAVEAPDTMLTTVLGINEPERHTAHMSFSEDGSRVYYSICDYVGVGAEIRCQLYMRDRLGETWGPAVKLPAPVNMDGYSSTQPSVGRSPNGKEEVLYFTSNRPKSKGYDIWAAEIKSDGFGNPARLREVNTDRDEYYPFYHRPSGTLYFSSDGYDNFGGQDIFRTSPSGNKFDDPVNLGTPINSPFNDICFNLTTDGNTAYFSSNRSGNIFSRDTVCCYDVFRACLVEPSLNVRALDETTGQPLDQVTITLREIDALGNVRDSVQQQDAPEGKIFPLQAGKTYIIHAHRPYCPAVTDTFSTPSYFCDRIDVDLWLKPAKVTLETYVYEWFKKQPAQPIYPTVAQLRTSDQPGGPVLKLHTDTLEASNMRRYPLEFKKAYHFRVGRAGYTTDTLAVSTDFYTEKDTVIVDTLYIERGIELRAMVFNKLNDMPIDSAVFRLVEVPTQLTDVRVNGAENTYASTIGYNSRYRIVVTRRGFSSDSLEFNTPLSTLQPFDTIYKKLYVHPLDLSYYLPIKLFFDNDRPVPRSWATTTEIQYSDTYFAYFDKKNEFIDLHSEGMTGDSLVNARNRVDKFFEDSVRGEWNRLFFFTEVLNEKLERGDTVEITLKGYASPLASATYNQNLTERRIACVNNHFARFDGGILNQYRRNGQLKIDREPNGEAKAPPNVSGNDKDRRFSVYSAEASHERRVEVVGVEIQARIQAPGAESGTTKPPTIPPK